MKRSFFVCLITGLVMGLPLSSRGADPDVAGDWKGTLNAGGVELRLVFHVTKQADGAFKGTMDSLDQGAKGIPVTAVSANGNTVRFEVGSINGSFEGKPDKNKSKIAGQWAQGPVSFPLTLEKMDPTKATSSEARKANPESIDANKKTGGKLVGHWNGTLNVGKDLRLIFKISKTAEGGLIGSVDSPDQGVSDIPISAISYADPKIKFELRTIGGTFQATLDKEGTRLSGDWQQGTGTLPLNLTKAAGK